MARTGSSFEMNPDTFMLENMFAMELHKHSSVIGDIVTSAVKELSIEKVLIFPYRSFLQIHCCDPVLVSVYLIGIFPYMFRTGCEGGGGHMGEHEVHRAALL